MSKVYILQALGFGDREDEFVNIGAYSSKEKMDAALVTLQEEWAEWDMGEVETRVEEYEVE